MFEYNICYSLDSKYAEQLAVSITSIIKNSEENEIINFYILDGGLTETDKSNIEHLKYIKDFKIEYIKINEDDFKCCPLLKENDELYLDYHVTIPTYFRFKLASFLKKVSNILYLDCDVIVRTSLKDLFSEDISNCAVRMVLDVESQKESERLSISDYYNAGVMYINLDYWRKNDVEKRLFEYAKNNVEDILWQDQDVINVVLKDEIMPLGINWNYQYFLYDEIEQNMLAECNILHLSGRFKPWLMSFEHPIYDEYYYYLSFTKWQKNIIQYKYLCSGKFLKNNVGGSVTNICINTTNEDIQSEANEIYKYIESSLVDIRKEAEGICKYCEKIVEDSEIHSRIATDSKVDRIYGEITKCYKYTEKLIDELKTLFWEDSYKKNDNLKIETEKIYKYYFDKFSELNKELATVNTLVNNLLEDVDVNYLKLKNEFDEKINNVSCILTNKEEINCDSKMDSASLYSYVNEQNLKLLSDFNTITGLNKKNAEDKIEKLNNYVNDIKNSYYSLESILSSKIDKEELDTSSVIIDSKLKQIELDYQNKLISLEKQFEENLVAQRLKYEEKIHTLEKKFDAFSTEQNKKHLSFTEKFRKCLKRDK